MSAQRPRKLTEIAGRLVFVDAILRRPAVGGQVQGPEQGVQNRELPGVVGVVGPRFTGVMPVVELRGGDQPPHRAEVHPHVGVDEDGLHRDEDDERAETDPAEAQGVSGSTAAERPKVSSSGCR